MRKLSLFSTALWLSLLVVGAACSETDQGNGGGAGASGAAATGNGAAGSTTSGNGQAGGTGTGTGTGGSAPGSCVDPRSEPSLIPLTDAAGSGVWEGFAVDGGELFFRDLNGLSAQPLAGGARRSVLPQGPSLFEVSGDKVRYVSVGVVHEVPRAGGSVTDVAQLPMGHTGALFTAGGLVIHNQSPLDDAGTLFLLRYDGSAPATIAAYESKITPFDFAAVGDRLFFVSTPSEPATRELASVPIAGGMVTLTPMPSGVKLSALLGVVGDHLYAVAEDDYLKNTVMKIDASGAIVASYVVTFGTAKRAVAVDGGVAIGGIEFVDLWRDGQAAAERVRCFQVGAGVSSPYPTIHDYAASGKDIFLSIRTPEPNQNAIQRFTLP